MTANKGNVTKLVVVVWKLERNWWLWIQNKNVWKIISERDGIKSENDTFSYPLLCNCEMYGMSNASKISSDKKLSIIEVVTTTCV